MYQMNSEKQYQPHVPVPTCPTPVHQQSSLSQQASLESFHGSPVNFLSSWGTRNMLSVDLTGTQVSQLVTGGRDGTQDLQWMALTQTAQPPPGASEYNRGAMANPQKTALPPFGGGRVAPPATHQCWQRHNGRVSSQSATQGTAGDMTACQLRNPSSSLPQGVAGAGAHSSQKPKAEALQKRELRLMKNRKAASESRIRKKEYMHYLEDRLAALEMENATLKVRLQLSNDTCPDE